MNQPSGSTALLRPAEIPGSADLRTGPAPLVPARRSWRVRKAVWGVPGLAWLIAAVFVALELALSDRYGFLQDELDRGAHDSARRGPGPAR
jgi:hypothetical protein